MGDYAWDLSVLCYSDADFAGDIKDSKSTSGCYLALVGPRTFIPIAAMSKKQSVVSHSSTESEIVSLEQGMRSEALPFLTLWEYVTAMMKNDTRARGKHQATLAAVPATGGMQPSGKPAGGSDSAHGDDERPKSFVSPWIQALSQEFADPQHKSPCTGTFWYTSEQGQFYLM